MGSDDQAGVATDLVLGTKLVFIVCGTGAMQHIVQTKFSSSVGELLAGVAIESDVDRVGGLGGAGPHPTPKEAAGARNGDCHGPLRGPQ
jgi:hypothetical protein